MIGKIEEALQDLKDGKIILVIDYPDIEKELESINKVVK